MPKIIIEFDMYEDKEDYELMLKAGKLSAAAEAFSNFLRSKLKYDTLTEEEYKIYESIREKFYEIYSE